MPIFKLDILDSENISKAELIPTEKTDLKLESHLESWLESNPWTLAQEPILWIDRQPSAKDEDGTVYPDLLGVDAEGNLMIVELKKGHAPRTVVAQLLEYTAWASDLSELQIHDIAETYFNTREEFNGTSFPDAFRSVFDIHETDEIPSLNRNIRLFIVAEEIPIRIYRVCSFLRSSYRMDINCIVFSTFQTESGDVIVNTETKVGDEVIDPPIAQQTKKSLHLRWSGEKSVKQVVWEAVQELTRGKTSFEFTIAEVKTIVNKQDPSFKLSNVSPEITADCVNSPSRHHYSSRIDRYWRIGRGKYRLYDPDNDRVEDYSDAGV